MKKIAGFFTFTFCILTFAFLVAGCGNITDNKNFYYNPAFTRDGKIIFIKGLQSDTKNAIGSQIGSSYTESLMTMTAAGASEHFIMDVTGNPPYAMTCSPVGDYVAYGNALSNGAFQKIVIQNIGTGQGLDRVELSFSPAVKAFDWSADGTKLVYCTSNEIHSIKLDGSGDTTIATVSDMIALAWKYGDRIAFSHLVGTNTILSMVTPAGVQMDLATAASVNLPQISSVDTGEVFGIAGTAFGSVEVTDASPAIGSIMAGFKGALPRIAATADKVVYSKTGEESGIYILNLSTGVETQIK